MLEELLTIVGHFEQLAEHLAALRALHAEDPEALAYLESAEHHVKRGAELARSQIDSLNLKRGG